MTATEQKSDNELTKDAPISRPHGSAIGCVRIYYEDLGNVLTAL